jgi:hypothetical protein
METSKTQLNYVPLDFIKGEILHPPMDHLLNCPELNFVQRVNTDTGEILQTISKNNKVKKQYRIAEYQNLVFKYYPDSDRLFIKGSLHKFFNLGEHNYNDFSAADFNKTLIRVYQLFKITPGQIKLSQLEWGVNITPPIDSNTIIENLLLFKRSFFEQKCVNYYQVELVEYFLKAYNKSFLHNLIREIFRFERKQMKYFQYCRKQHIGQTLQDLIDSDFKGLRDTLIANWKQVLLIDPFLPENPTDLMKYQTRNHWKKLLNKSRTNLMRHKRKMNSYNKELGSNIHQQILERMEEKLDYLNNEKVTFHHSIYTNVL